MMHLSKVQAATPQYCFSQIVRLMQDNNEAALSDWLTPQAHKQLTERVVEDSSYTHTCASSFTYAQQSRALALWLEEYPRTWQQTAPDHAQAFFGYGAQEVFEFQRTQEGWRLTNVDIRNGTPPCG